MKLYCTGVSLYCPEKLYISPQLEVMTEVKYSDILFENTKM